MGPFVGVLHGAWSRIIDRLTEHIGHTFLALTALMAVAAVVFLSGRTKVEGLLTVSDNAYTLFREDCKVPPLPLGHALGVKRRVRVPLSFPAPGASGRSCQCG